MRSVNIGRSRTSGTAKKLDRALSRGSKGAEEVEGG